MIAEPAAELQLSDQERARRWEVMRQLLDEQQLDALLVPPGPAMSPTDGYFTNDLPGATVVFPRDGEPTAIHRGGVFVGSWVQAREWGEAAWIDDWRFRDPAHAVIRDVMHEKGLDRARIGTVGVLKGPPIFPQGWTPYPYWRQVTEQLPGVDFVEVWDAFAAKWIIKSDEELELFRAASSLAELASKSLLAATDVGVTEAELYAAVQSEIFQAGGNTTFLILHSGPDNLSWGSPRWLHRAQAPRAISPGDVIVSEIFPIVGGINAQAQMCIAVGDVAEPFHKAGELAREAYERGLETIRPGIRFGELVDAMNAPLEREGAWNLTPHVHSMTPLQLVGPVLHGPRHATLAQDFPFTDLKVHGWHGGDTVLETGMTFQLEANAVIGRHRINIGGNVIVDDHGAEELNDISTRLNYLAI